MARKTLNVAAITNELQHSAFFPMSGVQPLASTPMPHANQATERLDTLQPPERVARQDMASAPTMPHSQRHDVAAARPPLGQPPREIPPNGQPRVYQANGLASGVASENASMLAHAPALVEAIRKSVRHIGKEVSFVRLTPEEKRLLADITYTYKSQGVKTSENEISRIGINWMLEDYHRHGQNSVLAQVIAALNA